MQTELHRHLDASLRLSTLLELLQKKGLEGQSTSLECFGEKFILRSPQQDLNTVLSKFKLFQLAFDSPEILERVGFEAIEDCYREGTRSVELRFSPSFVSEVGHLKWNEILFGFKRGIDKGLKKFHEMRAGLICIASRDYGLESVDETVDFYLKNKNLFIGIDLAGNERDFPCRHFADSFRKVKEAHLPITIHAGEDSDAQNIWEAIDLLGAERIGHGIRSIEDPTLLSELARRGICLEVCPTSNWVTGAVKDLRHHPIQKILKARVKACINTDDPGIFGISMPYELNLCRNLIGLSEEELALCEASAAASSFL